MRCHHVGSVAVVGAGPSGLAAAKYLRAEKRFDRIDVLEQRDSFGGLWNYTPDDRDEETFTVPLTDPWVSPQSSVGHQNGDSKTGPARVPTFVSPVYELLETNLPKQLMRFSDLPFSDQCQLFPKHPVVKDYIQEYGQDVLHLVKFQTQVIDVSLQCHTRGAERWMVKSIDLATNNVAEDVYDAVVVANGHFNVPFVPDIPGLAEWYRKDPVSVTHSKYYRRPEEYRNKKTIVVGTSASGSDVASQIEHVVRSPLLISARTMPQDPVAQSKHTLKLPQIVSMEATTRTVHFEDGRTETGVDSMIFCTGYLYSFPFLSSLDPPVVSHGSRLERTYQHLFFAPHPTLAFLGMPFKIVPFPIAESQSAVVARVFSGRLSLPHYETMQQWEADTIAETGDRGKFMALAFPKDWHYMNMLMDWADEADAADDCGKTPRKWGEWEGWATKHFADIRRAFMQRGTAREKIKALNELGPELVDLLKQSDNSRLERKGV